jgi:hypothetical protein
MMLAFVMATPTGSAANSPALDEVLKLKKSGMSPETIINFIKSKNQQYDLSADDMVSLKAQGVSEPIINALLASGINATNVAGVVKDSSSPEAKGTFSDPRQALFDPKIAEMVYEAIYAELDSLVRAKTGKSAIYLMNPKNVDDKGVYASLLGDRNFQGRMQSVPAGGQLKRSSGVDMWDVAMDVLERLLAKAGHPQSVTKAVRNDIVYKFWEKYLGPKVFSSESSK